MFFAERIGSSIPELFHGPCHGVHFLSNESLQGMNRTVKLHTYHLPADAAENQGGLTIP